MAIHTRYPRSFVVLVVLVSLLAVHLLFAPLDSIKRATGFNGSASSLKSLLAYEEAKYHAAVEDREALVRKWGPKAEDVEA